MTAAAERHNNPKLTQESIDHQREVTDVVAGEAIQEANTSSADQQVEIQQIDMPRRERPVGGTNGSSNNLYPHSSLQSGAVDVRFDPAKHGRSMSVIDDTEEAIDAMTPAAQHMKVLLETTMTRKPEIIAACHHLAEGQPISTDAAALLAELKSTFAYLYLIRFMDMLTFQDVQGHALREVGIYYRATSFYRLVAFLNMIGALRPETFEGDKLFLGAGSIVGDILPFCIDLKILKPEEAVEFEHLIHEPEDALEVFDQLIRNGVISLEHRSGKCIAVDSDEYFLNAGTRWTAALGLDIEPVLASTRGYLQENSRALTTRQLALVAGIRLDPKMVSGNITYQAEFEKHSEQFAQLINQILRRPKSSGNQGVKQPGQALFTIGSGNISLGENDDFRQWKDYRVRETTLKQLRQRLLLSPYILHQDLTKIPFCEPWISSVPEISDTQILLSNSGIRSI